MTEDDDKLIVMCAPEGWPGHVEATKAELQTGTCGHTVWVGQTSREMVLDSSVPVEFHCIPCVMAANPDGPPQMHITSKQRTELNKLMGVAHIDQFVAKNNITEKDF